MTTTKTLQRALGILFKTVTLAADVFRDATSNDEVDAQYIVHGTAKAWANLDGTGTIALRDSLNVASVVDEGTGDYTFNFSNAFNLGDYAVSGAVQAESTSDGAAQAFPLLTVEGTASPSASASRIFIRSARAAYGLRDYNNISPIFVGDLA